MGLLSKLKSILGLGDDEDRVGRRTDDVGVTVERERGESDATNEAAVKGVDGETDDAPVGESDETAPEAGAGVETGDEAEPDTDAEVDAGADADAEPEAAAEADRADEPAEADETDTVEEAAVGDEATVGEGTAEAGGADAAAGTDLQEIKGIGPAYADRLSEIGIGSVEELADADVEAVAEEADLAPGRVEQWVDRAKVRQ